MEEITPEKIDATILMTQIEALRERGFNRGVQIWHLVVAVIAICLTVFGGIATSYNNINANIVSLQKQDALFDVQITELRKKTDYYDQLIQRRDTQNQEVQTRLTKIETLLQVLTTKRQQDEL